MNQKNQTRYEFYGVPQSLTIENNKYTYKIYLKDEKNFIYRCSHRECKAQITIDKENILKALSQNHNSTIQHKQGKNPHTCKDNEKEKNKEVTKT